jgi:hypothetical protein
MRFHILRALLLKEVHRHLLNRGGLALAVLLVAAAVMLSYFNPGTGSAGTGGGGLVGGVHRCYVEYAAETPLVAALKARVPDDLRPHLVFRVRRSADVDGLITYEPGAAAIQIRTTPAGYKFWVWHPPGGAGAVAPYERWFFKAARDVLAEQAGGGDPRRSPADDGDDLWAVRESFARLKSDAPATPAVEIARDGLGAKELDLRSAVATGMVVFALYFACVYLLPTLNCEERERGVLLAQALSPASPAEILAAKFLFYPTLGIALAAALAAIYQPAVLGSLFFWLAVTAVAAGFLGIGMTVATLAKTQRAAFMGAMCYLLSVSLVLVVCTQNNIVAIPWLTVEFHGPRILHAAITREVRASHWLHLAAEAVLACCWILAAGWLFRRRGWQ